VVRRKLRRGQANSSVVDKRFGHGLGHGADGSIERSAREL
jgi:hypothetical protein